MSYPPILVANERLMELIEALRIDHEESVDDDHVPCERCACPVGRSYRLLVALASRQVTRTTSEDHTMWESLFAMTDEQAVSRQHRAAPRMGASEGELGGFRVDTISLVDTPPVKSESAWETFCSGLAYCEGCRQTKDRPESADRSAKFYCGECLKEGKGA